MNFLCPSCRTPLPPPAANQSADCTKCGVKVDLTGIETAPGQAKLWPQIDLASESLGPFKLTHTLGAGGMGAVYAATSPTGIGVAVKVLSPLLAAEPGLRERFRREAHALRAVDHRGVVRILDEGEERGFSWYAMEKIEGRDLREVLRKGRMTPAEVEGLARALLDALAAVHAAGLVHRDIKPGNILLSADGPKLCDFGIARFDGQATLTESAAIMGSLRYMAPEQRWGKSGPSSDLYGVGVVLHEALWGGVPGEVATGGGGVPKWLEEFVLRLVSQTADARPADARAALTLLDRLKGRWKTRLGAGLAMAAAVLAPLVWFAWPTAPAVVDGPPSPPLIATVIDAGPAVEGADAGEALAAAVPDAGPPPMRPEVALALMTRMTEARANQLTDDEKRALLTATGIAGLEQVSGKELDLGFRQVLGKLQAGTGVKGGKKPLPTKAVLSKVELAEPPRTGRLTASSVPPGAELWIDGKNTGRTSPAELELREGKHTVVFKLDGKSSAPRVVVITADAATALQDVAISAEPAPPPVKGKPVKGKSKKPSPKPVDPKQ